MLRCFPTSIPVKHLPSRLPGAYYAGFARANRFATIEELHEYPFQEVQGLMASNHYL
jgi:hypothetical protein